MGYSARFDECPGRAVRLADQEFSNEQKVDFDDRTTVVAEHKDTDQRQHIRGRSSGCGNALPLRVPFGASSFSDLLLSASPGRRGANSRILNDPHNIGRHSSR